MSALQHPAYGLLRPVTDNASVLLCNNPGKMTLEGTNTWVLRGPGSDEMVVVDPGPDDPGVSDEHIERLAALGRAHLLDDAEELADRQLLEREVVQLLLLHALLE